MFFDPLYLVFAAPALVLALIAQFLTKRTFAKYAEIPSSRGLTGAQAAQMMLERNGVTGVGIEPVNGMLTDHYDPTTRTLRLSEAVYASRSLSAMGVACHEAGHALQHAENYGPLTLRSKLVPVTNIGSSLSYFVLMAGFLMQSSQLILVGIVLFSLAVIFALITLPVEWDASARAKVAMVNAGIVSGDEAVSAGKVLNAAFLTYLAAAVSALMTLLYYILRYTMRGSRREE